jgi:hypothetical protein
MDVKLSSDVGFLRPTKRRRGSAPGSSPTGNLCLRRLAIHAPEDRIAAAGRGSNRRLCVRRSCAKPATGERVAATCVKYSLSFHWTGITFCTPHSDINAHGTHVPSATLRGSPGAGGRIHQCTQSGMVCGSKHRTDFGNILKIGAALQTPLLTTVPAPTRLPTPP